MYQAACALDGYIEWILPEAFPAGAFPDYDLKVDHDFGVNSEMLVNSGGQSQLGRVESTQRCLVKGRVNEG